MKKKPKAYKRSKRKEQVVLQLRIWHDNGYATEATSYKLAKALEIEPTQRFREMLAEMCNEGVLVRTPMNKTGRLPGWFYALSPSRVHYHEKYSKRRVNVKRKGVISAQLEMWQ